ncbi:hypothetical protein BGX29_005095 [Mortierella sp. GBA35]|nr:hypothetical protein BGX29_005095 [Mortierella sp. GBA35]
MYRNAARLRIILAKPTDSHVVLVTSFFLCDRRVEISREKCTEPSKFSYHNHAEDKVFESIVFAQPWNMLNLVKLRFYGVSPRAKDGNPSSPALLDHVKNLPMLSEVVVTEAVYRKLL